MCLFSCSHTHNAIRACTHTHKYTNTHAHTCKNAHTHAHTRRSIAPEAPASRAHTTRPGYPSSAPTTLPGQQPSSQATQPSPSPLPTLAAHTPTYLLSAPSSLLLLQQLVRSLHVTGAPPHTAHTDHGCQPCGVSDGVGAPSSSMHSAPSGLSRSVLGLPLGSEELLGLLGYCAAHAHRLVAVRAAKGVATTKQPLLSQRHYIQQQQQQSEREQLQAAAVDGFATSWAIARAALSVAPATCSNEGSEQAGARAQAPRHSSRTARAASAAAGGASGQAGSAASQQRHSHGHRVLGSGAGTGMHNPKQGGQPCQLLELLQQAVGAEAAVQGHGHARDVGGLLEVAGELWLCVYTLRLSS